MSSSRYVFVSDEFSRFLSASNKATGRVIETNKDIHSAASSATVSLVKNKSSSEEVVVLEVEERAERAEENWTLHLDYDWVNPKVQEYFSQYRYSSILCSFLF